MEKRVQHSDMNLVSHYLTETLSKAHCPPTVALFVISKEPIIRDRPMRWVPVSSPLVLCH